MKGFLENEKKNSPQRKTLNSRSNTAGTQIF